MSDDASDCEGAGETNMEGSVDRVASDSKLSRIQESSSTETESGNEQYESSENIMSDDASDCPDDLNIEGSVDRVESGSKLRVQESNSTQTESGNEQYESSEDAMSDGASECQWADELNMEGTIEDYRTQIQWRTRIVPTSPLPFPLLPYEWYLKQGKLYLANQKRSQHRKNTPIHQSKNFASLNRSNVLGTIQDNIRQLKDSNELLQKQKCYCKMKHLEKCIEVGEYIIQNGPIIATQDIVDVYYSSKEHVRMSSTIMYETLSKHFNIIQVYIAGKAYIIDNPNIDIEKFLLQVISTINTSHITNEVIKERIGALYANSLDYMDTPRDKQVLKGVMSIIANISFASRLEGKVSRYSSRTACKMLPLHIDNYKSIKKTSQIVRNDLTNIQQYVLTKRIIKMRKMKEIKIINKGRGRLMKITEFPELSHLLEYAFGEHDTRVCSGGGLESHPRLTDGTLYRTADNQTTMKSARRLLLSLAPEGFNISLSSCYNYTMNYRVGTAQAQRHHHGKDVNANVALCLPPRTGVCNLVVNLHWSTANVNLIVDAASNRKDSTVVLSKDAKAIVCGDIAPLQKPGRSWKKTVLPDHSWDQSQVNAVTPMTFLFVETYITHRETTNSADTVVHTDNVMCVTRSGQAVTLLYLSFYESDTTFRCFNELLYLLTLPSLDSLFRNPSSGKLKEEFILVVDNGPSEQPSSPIVQMLLARLLKFLKLKKIIQVSFAEYHSKRNFVERVHAIENFALSRHGPFSSCMLHQRSAPGSQEHKENMEAMANEVQQRLNACQYAKKPLQSFRGIQPENFIFNDEDNLKTFLSLTEERKALAPTSLCTYKPVKNSMFDNLVITWHLNELFSGSYIDDYKLLRNKDKEHVDKYTTCFISCDASAETNLVTKIQPLPDYCRWIRTCELHYMPLDEREKLERGVWDNTPGLFLPSIILELVYKIMQKPPADIILLIALLAWVKPNEVTEYFVICAEQIIYLYHTDMI